MHKRLSMDIGLILVAVALGGCSQGQPTGHLVITSVGKTISCPAALVSDRAELDRLADEQLAIMAGAEDELPHGPQGFEILKNNRIVVTDPIRRRIVFYVYSGSAGKFHDQRLQRSSRGRFRIGGQRRRQRHAGCVYLYLQGRVDQHNNREQVRQRAVR